MLKAPFLKRVYVEAQFAADDYPLSLPLFRNGLDLELVRPITILVGENGSGKSTFVEAIAASCGFNLNSGSRDHGYNRKASDIDALSGAIRLSWLPKVTQGFFMRAESFHDFADYLDELAKEHGPEEVFQAYGGKSLNARSHGEAFMELFNARFGRQGMYILDEPEAALSPQRQLAFLSLLMQLSEEGCHQIIMATHSPILMAVPGSQLLEIEDGTLSARDYKETRHYLLMKRFLSDPDRYIEQIRIKD